MKNLLLCFLLFVCVALAGVYLLIPSVIDVNNEISINVNRKGFYRKITDQNNWQHWWPHKNDTFNVSMVYSYDGFQYKIVDKLITSIIILINKKPLQGTTALDIMPQQDDSVRVVWHGKFLASANPFTRIKIFYECKRLQKDMNIILQEMKGFFSDPVNVYGYNIKQVPVLDSTLVSTYAISKGYPTEDLIYGLIGELKNYASSKSAVASGYPMLNISTDDSISYFTRVALPVNKKLSDQGNISYRWMLGGGNILMTDVVGGPHAIAKAMIEMENYVDDHKRIAPAIPFQSLITDRSSMKDTAQWKTRIYWPVM